MNKLNKQITATFFRDPGGYAELKARWSGLMRHRTCRKSLTAAHHLLYLILRGKNWQKAFAPMTNPVKLENGGLYNGGGRKALRALHLLSYEEQLLEPFEDLLHLDALTAIRERVPPLKWADDPLAREPYRD